MMEKLIQQFIEAAKKNHKGFKRLKTAVVTCQQFELAAALRDIEREVWPETDEQKEAKERAKQLNLLFRMVDLKVDHRTCYLISETLKAYDLKGEDFSIEDAAKIQAKTEELFLTSPIVGEEME